MLFNSGWKIFIVFTALTIVCAFAALVEPTHAGEEQEINNEVAPTPLPRANPARLLYLQALDQIVENDPEASLKTLQYLIRRYPRSVYAKKAHSIVQALQEDGSASFDLKTIIKMFKEEYLTKTPDKPKQPPAPTPEPTPTTAEKVDKMMDIIQQAGADANTSTAAEDTGVLGDIMAMTEGIEPSEKQPDNLVANEESTAVVAPVVASEKKQDLSKAQIVSTIKKNWGRVKVCIGWSRQKNPNLTGKCLISFKIHPTGQVSETKVVNSTVGDPDLERCLMNRVSNMTFPTFDGEAKTVKYPFVVTK